MFALAATCAALFGVEPEPSSRLSAALYAIDAEVVTRPLPACSTEPRAVSVAQQRGAHPALSPDGAQLWFDAASDADGGRRQIHRMDRATGKVVCWTCGDLGNNVHPSISPSGVSLVFQSDRHATWRHPDDTDLYLAAAQPTAKPVDILQGFLGVLQLQIAAVMVMLEQQRAVVLIVRVDDLDDRDRAGADVTDQGVLDVLPALFVGDMADHLFIAAGFVLEQIQFANQILGQIAAQKRAVALDLAHWRSWRTVGR